MKIAKTLNLVNISHQDVGIYTCFVWFEYINYRHVQQFDLRLLAVPLQPMKLKPMNLTQTSVTFTWESDPFDHLTLADEASVQHSFKISLTKAYRWKIDQPTTLITNESTITIADLAPNTSYKIEVRSFNKYGESEPSRHDFITSGKSDADANINYDTQLIAKLGQQLTIPCRRYGNIKGITWKKLSSVYRYPVTPATVCTHFPPLPPLPPRPIYQAENLGSYTIINVETSDAGLYQCQAPYSDGLNEMQDIFITRVSITIPPKSLSNLQCAKINGNIVVKWTSSNDVNEQTSDLADKIQIRYHKVDGRFQNVWEELIMPPTGSSVNISGLYHGFLYVFRLTAINEAGESAPRACACSF